MKMKTFRAKTMRGAMNQAKATLGPDAVIVSTRELGSGRVELVAALDPEPKPAPLKRESAGNNAEENWFMPDPELVRGVFTELSEMRREIAKLRSERTTVSRQGRDWEQLMAELKELGRVMGTRGSDQSDALLTRLLAGGVEVSLAQSLVQQATKLSSDNTQRTRAVTAGMQRAFTPAPAVWQRDKHTVAAFVGPTGVGKTTTLAKVAATASLSRGMNVAMIAADTYRIGAVEQVRTYAGLLGVPCVVAQGQAELKQALSRFSDKDLVLIDTAGGNPWADGTLEKTDALLGGLPIERHLCVTAGTSGADASRIVNRYRKSGVRSLVVTKMDEARSMGGVLSTVWGTDLQIAHVTCGQEVPGDIETPNPASLAAAVLG